jgi:protease-4
VKDLLKKVGIEMQELRMGRYKSAAEMFARSGPSDPVREETQAILDDVYDDLVSSVAENRSLKPVVVRSLIDRAMFSAEEAREAGLVDHVEYDDEFLARILKEDSSKLKIVEAKVGKKLELTTGGFAGMMALMNELFGGPRKALSSKKPKIALIHGNGAIVTGGGQESLFGGSMMTSDEMVKLFRQVRQDETVKAVVFRVNSPGGSALASDLIWREVKLTAEKKPVVVSMSDVAASGGYYVSCGATCIFSEKSTLTGSIGVIGAIPDMTGLFGKLGVRYSTFSRGKRAEVVSPYGELSDDGREMLMKYMRRVYDDFIARVAEGRKLPEEAVASIAEGRVWTGVQALKLGLVDELGGLDAAMAKARCLGKVPEDAEIISLPKAKTLFELLTEIDAAAWSWRTITGGLPREIKTLLRSAEWVGAARRDRFMTVLPEIIRFQ